MSTDTVAIYQTVNTAQQADNPNANSAVYFNINVVRVTLTFMSIFVYCANLLSDCYC